MTKFLATAFISLFLISFFLLTGGALALDTQGKDCKDCHELSLTGAHKNTPCKSCHAETSEHFAKAADFSGKAEGCLRCHEDYKNMLHSEMRTRDTEQKYAEDAFGSLDNRFFSKNCSGCHLTSCTDCHEGKTPHDIVKPSTETCLKCHNGYFTGIEYIGLGQREDHERYDRGISHKGENYAKMLPDIHHEKGMDCAACHSMKSLAEGMKSSKSCTDCHEIKNTSIEHSVPEHMEKLECHSCHSAWASQEYGTFWIRFKNTKYSDYFRWLKSADDNYAKSSHTKIYSPPPLGINKAGKYSPVRPMFLAFCTYIVKDKVQGKENAMASNRFKAFFPHTVRRETVTCESCHANDRRLMRNSDDNRTFHPDEDGLPIKNFFNSREYYVANGRFINNEEYRTITGSSDEYKKLTVKKWIELNSVIKK
jgi:hypothetical protein